MRHKGKEYRPFNQNNAKEIFNKLQAYIPLTSRRSVNIQILGTNGKGSTGRFLALALHKYKVLHFTSPHIFDFKERFYKNGKIISEIELEEAHRFLQQFSFMQDASYFEYATFLAFILSFDVDYFIIECGLGGEYDSTSVLPRDYCIFSVIDYDHQDILGDSIKEIATTKLRAMCGISILGKQKYAEVETIAHKIAKNKNVVLRHSRSDFDITAYSNKYNLAEFLCENLQLALSVVEILGLKYDLETMPKLDLLGRFQRISNNVIIDVGHNANAAFAIKNEIKDKKIILVYNSYFQKDVKKILKILRENIICVEIIKVPNNDRIIPFDKLRNIVESYDLPCIEFSSVNEGREYLVFGSFSVVEIFLKQQKFLR